ncbi:hypothetical protein IW261DRAFT_1454672 [Armillaria novae-zelandiae]|uniref:BTB domain-containing protein n=1 Tax=Armillaria novae-zelandiae TaxID=153914 RepID=A0AA39UK78_9AGAR|nr:hypothetical protein IW261DRAFT_1454672 [Armillaria novae-zelandiae]
MHDEQSNAESFSMASPKSEASDIAYDIASDAQQGPGEVPKVRNVNFYWENSTFLETFKAMFTLPQADADAGISKIDFERLLNFMYPLYGIFLFAEKRRRPLEAWISILKLSTMWGMIEIRDSAISHLMERHLEIEVVKRITLGRSHDVPALVRSGLVTLVNQDGGVTEQQARLLGWETALRIQWVRDKLIAGGSSHSFGENELREAATSVFCMNPRVERTFESEIFDPKVRKISGRGPVPGTGRRGGRKS